LQKVLFDVYKSRLGERMKLVTVGEVRLAFRNTLGKKGMLESDTDQLADYLMGFFGFSEQTIDNCLSSEDRDVFYMLEEEGFLTTWQEEVHLEQGKVWRIHYWILKTDQIQRMAQQENNVLSKTEGMPMSYDEVPDDCWQRSK
jgi:hypothetical protein